ncbi:MAG: hypothetical protein M3R65_01630, partial [Gemmatimonadota bacterium]|nr:hypothetical protein [Gemmatimonadota bacterium]
MIIRLTRRKDGDVVLRCDRPDGTSSWQRQKGSLASVFPSHDITHYVVESELGFRSGFFGLIAGGWDINETTGKSARGPIPREALTVEQIVGFFDVQRSLGAEWTAEQMNQHARVYAESRGLETVRPLTENELVRIRARLRELTARWASLQPDETLELPFDTA